MEQATRNRLRNVVTQCRKLLEESIAQQLEGQFGIRADKKDAVQIEDEVRMSHLPKEDQRYRRDLLDHLDHINARSFKPKEALDQLIRELAFTHLNRLCAYKMMEARDVYVGGQKVRESVGRGINSNGFKFYLADHPDDERLFNTGGQERAYRHFLDWLGGQLSEEIGVLFNPNDPANRLYPRQKTLDELIDLLNGEDIKPEETELRESWPTIWEQDETIGWVYQYFTPKELRDQARKESSAPRNSYELAFRNQFFTPRYVVEFLTDNTLGRIWYEMRKGNTKLKDQCRYLVRRPTEIFLDQGQEPPENAEARDDMSQVELLKQPVHIRHRLKKDPRELKILDPASGSGHFLLYCFDLLLTIYEEAYTDIDLGPALQHAYPDLEDLRRDVPRLILAHNVHGIDIDLRATQIAALALWLRCQWAYQEMGLRKDRPAITRSNFVCAEPMPGENETLKEFVRQLEPKLLGQLVEVVFDEMKLAGEAGSLLKIEEKISGAVAAAKKQWLAGPLVVQRGLFDTGATKSQKQRFDLSGISDEEFFEQAEARVLEELGHYTENAQDGKRLQRQLFTGDAMRGFAFIDLCRKRFDVALMNPPFGYSSKVSKILIDKQYPRTKHDLYAAFVERGIDRLHRGGRLGAITSRTGFFLATFQEWRESILLGKNRPTVLADLGYGVLDTAMVETCAYRIESQEESAPTPFFRVLETDDKARSIEQLVRDLHLGIARREHFSVKPSSFRRIPRSPFAYWISNRIRCLFERMERFETEDRVARQGAVTGNDARFVRAWWEVRLWETKPTRKWVPFAKSGTSSPYYCDIPLVVPWDAERGTFTGHRGLLHRPSLKPANASLFLLPGLTWPLRARRFRPAVMPAGCVFSIRGYAILAPKNDLWTILGVTASRTFDFLFKIALGRSGYPEFVVGVLQRLPFPDEVPSHSIGETAKKIFLIRRQMCSSDETDHAFVLPALLQNEAQSLSERIAKWQGQIEDMQNESLALEHLIDQAGDELYGMSEDDRRSVTEGDVAAAQECDAAIDDTDPEGATAESGGEARQLVSDVMSYCVGSHLGRWDVRTIGNAGGVSEWHDAFEPLCWYSSAMLQGQDGLLATEVPGDYPLRIDWDGVVADDSGHQDDIIRRVREVLELIWKDRAYAIEVEACEILGVKTLRDYFRKPGKGGFWDDHVKRYSKSRRKAPIYWLLQSSKKNYALWLYYHRLDKAMLFKGLQNYVEPKIQREENRLGEFRSQKSSASDSGKGAKKLDRDIERQEDLISELRDFQEKLRKVADMHLVPDLDDGVVLNIAPLHELVPWKEAKKYWNDLLNGEYAWSLIGKQLREKGVVK